MVGRPFFAAYDPHASGAICVRTVRVEISLAQRDIWLSTREAIPVQHALILEVGHHGVTGFGEASAFVTDHYNSGMEQLHSDLRRVAPLLAKLHPDNPFDA